MAGHIVTPEGRRLKKIAAPTTTPVSDTSVKEVHVDAPRVCYNMPNEEFFPLMMRLRDKAVRLMGDRLAELARWNETDRDKVALWFGEASEAIRQTLIDGLPRMREIMSTLTEKNFVRETAEGIAAVGCVMASNDATASVCKPDGTFTIFIASKFCDLEADEIDFKTGMTRAKDSKLIVLIHEVSHFPVAMNTEDPIYGIPSVKEAARKKNPILMGNAGSVAYYVVNMPNWRYTPPSWKKNKINYIL